MPRNNDIRRQLDFIVGALTYTMAESNLKDAPAIAADLVRFAAAGLRGTLANESKSTRSIAGAKTHHGDCSMSILSLVLSLGLLILGLATLAYWRAPLWLAAIVAVGVAVAVGMYAPIAWPVDLVF